MIVMEILYSLISEALTQEVAGIAVLATKMLHTCNMYNNSSLIIE